MKALAGALLPLLLIVAGAHDRYPDCLGSYLEHILGFLGQPFCCVSPSFSSRGVCAYVTHPEVQMGRYRGRAGSAGL